MIKALVCVQLANSPRLAKAAHGWEKFPNYSRNTVTNVANLEWHGLNLNNPG
jgi:hypothetical protein